LWIKSTRQLDTNRVSQSKANAQSKRFPFTKLGPGAKIDTIWGG
jgi:hypothetical protein